MRVKIQNFKCHKLLDFNFPSLTVFCGRNNAGKSSVIQALLLYRLADRALLSVNAKKTMISLNDPKFDLALGRATDLRSRGTETSEPIVIGYGDYDIQFLTDDASSDDDFVWVNKIEKKGRADFEFTGPASNIPRFVYLSAERIGPRLIQPKRQGYKLLENGIGCYGENAAEFLKLVQHRPIDESLASKSRAEAVWVLKHLEYWLGRLFGNISVRVEDNGQFAPPSIQLRSANLNSDWTSPTHYGFGVSYALPILLAGLASLEKHTLIIDSPEAHLHPAAQTEMAKFLAMLAAAGRKIIIETHSDHIVDGIRLVVAHSEFGISPDNCSLLFFASDERNIPSVKKIDIKKDGSLSCWPAGFFDQLSLNLRALSEAKRNGRTT